MKIDRSVKVMLMLIVVLLALNFAKDIKLSAHANDNSKNSKSSLFENTVEAAPPPSFLQVGKSYESSAGGFIVLEIQSTGWIKAKSTSNEIIWVNSNAITYITPRN